MIIDCISDLHGHYPILEGGDLLIVAGDLTARDMHEEYCKFYDWLNHQNYTKKIFIGGNHDNYIQKADNDYLLDLMKSGYDRCGYLCDSGTEFEGLKIWGTPWTKTFPGMNPKCMAFTEPYGCDQEEWLAEHWALIPEDTDILITHSPPYGIRDKAKRYNERGYWNPEYAYENVGSKSLALRVSRMANPPKLWVWGHIHESYGRDQAVRQKPCIMVNASHVNEIYDPVNEPIRVIL